MTGRRALRSFDTSRLVVPPVRLSTVANQAFPVVDRCRSSVNFGGKTFRPKIMHEILSKCPNFNDIFTKIPEFYMTIARKILFPNFFFFGGGEGAGTWAGARAPLPSYGVVDPRIWNDIPADVTSVAVYISPAAENPSLCN